ncbi:MAG: cytochrome c oxidase subunit 3 [Pseudomonas sp.]|jgi:cytochrome c oxidase subunit 3|uniref:cytochrome c oxidase subunit 3 n=1 Tax=Halopseudomonas TaxID=2901189 RepID=UPI001B62DA43|nr:cytochrome c oxidase subunit 3 [Pseudomonas sp.]MBQ0776273.1 cytochrome c oxidase subunit 3 [Pseudomonas sp.]|tara:strand:+ start:190 stop:1080 length:891 start_codon:yes stop_codon:yes gene_type:complete
MASHDTTSTHEEYYVPAQSKWPIVGSIGLLTSVFGAGTLMNSSGESGLFILLAGALIIIWMFFGWFGNVITESHQGLYSAQMDRSFRMGMGWFIFSEVMFFAAFFGALFYVRTFAGPWLSGEGDKGISNMLWEGFQYSWPLMANPDPALFPGPEETISPWQLPLINTILLITSSVTVTFAHHALRAGKRGALKNWLLLTVVLAVVFLSLQIAEYVHAYQDLGLTLNSGIYGATFFMLTGFHGAHVFMGTLILTVMLVRVHKGHFTPENHFGFEAASWYWHFVDVVWVGLFIFVYIF